MKHGKILKTGMVLALTAASVHASASSSQDGLDACAEAMVNDLAANQGAPLVYNLAPDSKSGRGRLRQRQVFHLDARSADGETIVARMDCVVNSKAEVTQLIVVPLDGDDARLRATTFN